MPSVTTESFTPDRLFAGSFQRQTIEITLSAGDLTRGSVLGRKTADDKFLLSASAAGDGSEVPVAILADDVDASGGEKVAIAYVTGEFNEDALTFGAGHTIASTKVGLEALNIYLKTPHSA